MDIKITRSADKSEGWCLTISGQRSVALTQDELLLLYEAARRAVQTVWHSEHIRIRTIDWEDCPFCDEEDRVHQIHRFNGQEGLDGCRACRVYGRVGQ